MSEERTEWRELPVGVWFFEDTPSCTNRFSVQERTHGGCTIVCSTPYIHARAKRQMKEIAEQHNRAYADAQSTGPLREKLNQVIAELKAECRHVNSEGGLPCGLPKGSLVHFAVQLADYHEFAGGSSRAEAEQGKEK